MARLIIRQGTDRREIEFEAPLLLQRILEQGGFAQLHPCGGRGFCGKCVVTVSGDVSAPTSIEEKFGVRLSCQTVVNGDAEVILGERTGMERIEIGIDEAELTAVAPHAGRIGAAIDIGTTTLALALIDLATGSILARAAQRNPQTQVAADVIGRIEAALGGRLALLEDLILSALGGLLQTACDQAKVKLDEVDCLLITGNTTMLYLLTGRNPESLARAPFKADTLFDEEKTLLGRSAYLPPCMNAFVGADITTAVLASGMCETNKTKLLCDLGTNGELALWKDGRLYVTSTAAGPAFEGAGISCGCASIRGAIDRVDVADGEIVAHTIGDVPAVGVCGSGLIDAIAAFLKTEAIDETGAVDEDLDLRDGVSLDPKDVRAVQLAKAAIAAGMQTLLQTAGVEEDEIETLYIAGGFGKHLNIESAVAIGLIPEALKDRVRVIGNAALGGAVKMLLDVTSLERVRQLAAQSQHVNLGGNPVFNENYMEQMFFPEQE